VIERVNESPPAGIFPDTPSSPPLVPSADKPNVRQILTGEMKRFESFKNDAALLVERFKSARQNAVKSSFVKDKLKARRELADIKMMKESLRSEINQSSLSSSEKMELENLLSTISD
jgi:hypothetical protein